MELNINKSKKIGYLIGLFAFILVAAGATYAWLTYRSNNIAINGSSECFDVIYSKQDLGTQGNPAKIRFLEDYTEAEYAEVSLALDPDCATVAGKAKIYLTTNVLTDSEILTGGLYYSLVRVENNNQTLLSEGPITSTGDLLLEDSIYVSSATNNYTYRVYVWVNGEAKNNNNQYIADTSYVGKSYIGEIRSEVASIDTTVLATTYIKNLYNNATKTQYTDSKYNITYNYATSVNLMNDRLGSMSTNIDEGNIRYYGQNPNNYVTFNGELWRIIGVFNNKLKIIRNESIGSYSFDSSDFSVNKGYGVNQWGESTHSTDNSKYDGSDLMKLLNPGYETNTDKSCLTTPVSDGTYYNCNNNADEDYESILVNNSLYWNSGSGKCYNGVNSKTANCNFTTTGLKSEAKSMIASEVWYLGTHSKNTDPYNGQMNASKLYEWEHSNNSGIQCARNSIYCSTDVLGTTTWSGKVGLMSPSDYAYATGGGTEGLNTCISNNPGYVASGSSIANWYYNYNTCISDDWLFNSSYQWTMAPRADSSSAFSVFTVGGSGNVYNNNANNANGVRPVVYLKSDVAIDTVGNDGSQSHPFVLR